MSWFDVDGETNGDKHKDKDKSQGMRIQRGDVYRFKPGTIFYIRSSLDDERRKLRIYAIFANSEGDLGVRSVRLASQFLELLICYIIHNAMEINSI